MGLTFTTEGDEDRLLVRIMGSHFLIAVVRDATGASQSAALSISRSIVDNRKIKKLFYNTIKLYLMIGISGNANITANALSTGAVRGSSSEVQTSKALIGGEGASYGGTASTEPSLNFYQLTSTSTDIGKDHYHKGVVNNVSSGGTAGSVGPAAASISSSLKSSTSPVMGESSTTTASSSSQQNMVIKNF